MSILHKVKGVISKPKLPHGLYMYRGRDSYAGLALQLRVEPNGTGLLVINANTVLYLNRTATAHAYHLMRTSNGK